MPLTRSKNKDQDLFSSQRTLDFVDANEAPRKLSVDQLRKHHGHENTSDEEATAIIETLYNLSIIAYLFYIDSQESSDYQKF